MEKDAKARVFLGICVLAGMFILGTGPLFEPQNLTSGMVEIFGVLIILWALLARKMTSHYGKHGLGPGSFFVKHGPYEIIRHPIYAGIFLIASSLVQYDFTFFRVVAFLLLVLMIFLKIIREEIIVEQKIPEYREYKKSTKKLIPYLF